MLQEQVQLGVNQPLQSGDDYPFLTQGKPFSDILLDLSIQYRPGTHKLPLRLTEASNLPTLNENQIRLQIEDADGNLVFKGHVSNFQRRASWSSFYTTMLWGNDDIQLVAVFGSEYNANVPATLTNPITLDPRTCIPLLPGVSRLTVHPSRASSLSYVLPRNIPIEIQPGFNMAITTGGMAARTDSGGRLGTSMTFSAIAGAGEGSYSECGDPARLLRSISGQGGRGGNFLIGGTDCFRIEPLVTPDAGGYRIEPGVLRLADDCLPDCDCEDYVPIYRSLERLTRRLRTVGEYLEALRDTYEFLRQRAAETVECRNRQLQANVARSDDCEVAITGHFYNDSDERLEDRFLVFEVYEEIDDDQWAPISPYAIPHVAARYSQEEDQINVPLEFIEPNMYIAPIACIGPGETKSLGFRIDLETDNDIRVCVYEYSSPQNVVCHSTPTACTRANPDFNPFP